MKTVQGWGLLGVSGANGEASELGQGDHVGWAGTPLGRSLEAVPWIGFGL